MKLRKFIEFLNEIDEKYPDAKIELTSLKSIIIYPKKENAFIINLNNIDKEYKIKRDDIPVENIKNAVDMMLNSKCTDSFVVPKEAKDLENEEDEKKEKSLYIGFDWYTLQDIEGMIKKYGYKIVKDFGMKRDD